MVSSNIEPSSFVPATLTSTQADEFEDRDISAARMLALKEDAKRLGINIRPGLLEQMVASYFTAVLLWSIMIDRKTKEKIQVCFRVVGMYDENWNLTWKFPGGDHENRYDFPIDNGEREADEEIFRDTTEVGLDHKKVVNIYCYDLPDQKLNPQKRPDGWQHRKFFFLGCEEDLRNYNDERCFRGRPERDGEDFISASMVVPVIVLVRGMNGMFQRKHLPALIMAVRALATNPEVFKYIPREVSVWAERTDPRNPKFLYE